MAKRGIRGPKYLVIDGCACPADVAPYVFLVLRKAGLTASSIYRGQDPAAGAIMRKYGKHTQKQLVQASPAQCRAWGVTGTPNPYNRSQHELRDSNGKPISSWKIGVDAGPNTDANRRRLRAAGAHYGLVVTFPYNSVVEYHHWQFARQPRPNGALYKGRVLITRAYLRARSPR